MSNVVDLYWFPFLPKDWLASRSVRLMTRTERSIYLDLLCTQWLDGSIPGDIEDMALLLTVPIAEMAAAWVRMSHLFVTGEQLAELWVGDCEKWRMPTVPDGSLVTFRMECDRAQQTARFEALSQRGKSGGRPKTTAGKAQTGTEAARNADVDASANSKPSLVVIDGGLSDTQESPSNHQVSTKKAPCEVGPKQSEFDIDTESNPPECITPPGLTPECKAASAPLQTPYKNAERVLTLISETLGGALPKPGNVKRHLTPDGPMQTLIGQYGAVGTAKLFLFALDNWTHAPTWPSVCDQHTVLAAAIRKAVARKPQPTTHDDLEAARESAARG